MPPTRHDFESQLRRILSETAERGRPDMEIEAADLHRVVGGYPSRDGNHRMPLCCAVMRAAMKPGDTVEWEPPSGQGPRLRVRFTLPRREDDGSSRRQDESRSQPGIASPSASNPRPESRPTSPGIDDFPAGARVVLVSCVKGKQKTRSAARTLYTSPFFRLMRAYAEANGDTWYILSAEYGLLHPDQVVETYERTLKKMSRQERAVWGHRVCDQLRRVLPTGAEVCLLAGALYRQPIEPFLSQSGHLVVVPMRGLGFGEQLHWLKTATGERDCG